MCVSRQPKCIVISASDPFIRKCTNIAWQESHLCPLPLYKSLILFFPFFSRSVVWRYYTCVSIIFSWLIHGYWCQPNSTHILKGRWAGTKKIITTLGGGCIHSSQFIMFFIFPYWLRLHHHPVDCFDHFACLLWQWGLGSGFGIASPSPMAHITSIATVP